MAAKEAIMSEYYEGRKKRSERTPSKRLPIPFGEILTAIFHSSVVEQIKMIERSLRFLLSTCPSKERTAKVFSCCIQIAWDISLAKHLLSTQLVMHHIVIIH